MCPGFWVHINDGNFIFSEEEYTEIINNDQSIKHLMHRYVGAKDFLNNDEVRYCMWLNDVDPREYVHNKEIIRRLNAIKSFREKSSAEPTRRSAATPYRFFSAPQKNTNYLIIPRVSSERRKYIPIGFMTPDIIAADSCSIVLDATLYMFGVLTSNVHMAWMRVVAGRLKSDYRYSGSMVYNTFPWPNPSEEQRYLIEKTAENVLLAREEYKGLTLAEIYGEHFYLYDKLVKAHQANDKAVMQAYGMPIKETDESACVAWLMRMYQEIVSTKKE